MPRSVRHPVRDRVRAVAIAALLASSLFSIEAAPLEIPLPIPRPEALQPSVAEAAFCASNPTLSGRLTASASSTSAVSRITNGNVYGYISNVNSAWSCTAYLRYSGIAWNTTASLGTFDWGNLINSTSVACNWIVGTTDYLKANTTTDCPDTDAEYAMQVTLSPQQVYQADASHDGIGDFSFVHADCGSYYGGEPIKTGQNFNTGNASNRPGSNCDPLTIDGQNTSQTITYDATAPALNFDAPAAGGPAGRSSTAYTVQFDATDTVAGFGGTNDWDLHRQIATLTAGTCGTFANDTAAGNLVSGTTSAANQTSAQTLVDVTCYRWTLGARDQNTNAATTITSGSILIDTTAATLDFSAPDEGSAAQQGVTTTTVAWAESDPQSGIAGRSLQRQRVAVSGGACGTSWANDGSVVTTVSPVAVTGLLSGYCYRWLQSLTNGAGTVTAVTSGSILVDTTIPTVDFTTPAEGTTALQTATTYSVAWTETPGSGATISSRSLQRQRGSVVTSATCAGVTFANDGSPVTTASPVNVTGLLGGYCYRWLETLTNSLGKVATGTSGSILVDTTAPTAVIAFPEANRPLAGDVTITGTASDAGSFLNYQLEYGVGPSPASWITIATPTVQVTGTGTLGTWSTGTLAGTHTLRLTVRESAGNPATVVTRLVYLDNTRRGEEAYWTRQAFDLGGGYDLAIGVANGEATLSRELFTIPSYGPPQSLRLAYSSLETTTAGRFGYGWVSNLSQYLTFEDGFVVWHRADGGRVPFGSVGGTWTPLRGHFEVMGTGSGIYTITLKDQTKLTFQNAAPGRLAMIENRFGKALSLVWNTSSATATDASARVTNIVIDSANDRITQVTDSAGRVWGFGYTGQDLTSITDPASKVTTLAYDGGHHLTTITRSRTPASGPVETIVWSIGYTSGKATSVTDPINTSVANTFTYNPTSTDVGLLQTYSPLVRNTWTHAYDAWGRVTSSLDPTGFATSQAFDADSNLLTITRPIDASTPATTTYTYDTRGNVLTEVSPLDASTNVTSVMTYNATNDLLTRAEADTDTGVRLITLNTYDASGHLTSVDVNCTTSGTTPPTPAASCTGAGTQNASTNLITTMTWTGKHLLDWQTDALGRVENHAYDTYGNMTAVYENYISGQSATADRNVTTSYAFDQATTAGKAGLPTSMTDPVGVVTTYTYDLLGRQLTEVQPGDASIPALTRTTAYDEFGNVLTETESWTGGTRTTTHVYDKADRETMTTVEAGTNDIVTTNAYDAAGDTVQTVADGVTTDRSFDGLGRLLTETVDATSTTRRGSTRGAMAWPPSWLAIPAVDSRRSASREAASLAQRTVSGSPSATCPISVSSRDIAGEDEPVSILFTTG